MEQLYIKSGVNNKEMMHTPIYDEIASVLGSPKIAYVKSLRGGKEVLEYKDKIITHLSIEQFKKILDDRIPKIEVLMKGKGEGFFKEMEQVYFLDERLFKKKIERLIPTLKKDLFTQKLNPGSILKMEEGRKKTQLVFELENKYKIAKQYQAKTIQELQAEEKNNNNFYSDITPEFFDQVYAHFLNDLFYAVRYLASTIGKLNVYEVVDTYEDLGVIFSDEIAENQNENELGLINDIPEFNHESPRHKLILLHELGILQPLREKYNISKQDFARLIGLLTGITDKGAIDTFRKEVDAVIYKQPASGKGGSPYTKGAVKAVKSALLNIGIEAENLPDFEHL